MNKQPSSSEFDIDKIDEVIHGRIRLGVMAYLAAAEAAEFNQLKDKLKTTDGTLSVHLRKLEDVGYVAIEKTFRDRRPLTRATITRSGREAFARYLKALGNLTGLGS